MEEPVPRRRHGPGDTSFFYVHVEGVEHEPDVVPARPLAQVEALFDRVHEVGLEAVQGLDGEADAPFPGVISHLAQAFHRPGPLLFPLVGRQQPGLACGRVHGAGHVGRAHRRGQVDAAFEVGHPLGPASRLLVGDVPVGPEGAAHRHLHPGAAGGGDERLGAEPGRVLHAHFEDLEADAPGVLEEVACPRR